MRVRIVLEIEVNEKFKADETPESIANEITNAIDDNYDSVAVTESVLLD